MGKLLEKRKRKNVKSEKILYTIIILVVALLLIIPFIFMLSGSFKYSADVMTTPLQLIPKKINMNNYFDVFKEKLFLNWYANTIFVVISVIVLKLIVVATAAYAFAKLKFRGKNILFMYILAGMMVPGDLTIIAKYIEFKSIGITDSLLAIILPGVCDAWFLVVLRQFFTSIPNELSEAAFIDGCSYFKIFSRIVMPLSRPAIMTMSVFTFIWNWNSYLEPSIFITTLSKQMLSVGIGFFAQSVTGAGTNSAQLMAASTLSLIPVIAGFTFLQKYFIEGISSSGIKG